MSSPATTASDLVGRSGEQAVLRRIGDDLADGTGGGVLLAGQAGIGKSALHEWYLERAPTEATVLRVEVDPDLPGLGLEELLARLGIRAGPGDTADLRNASADAAALEVTEQVGRRLDELLLNQPVLIGIEDLHWANPTLLVTLRRISRMIRDRPLQLIATLRPDRSNPVLSRTLELLEQSGLTRLELDQLRPDDALELASQLTGARPIGRFRRLIERAGGNPLLLRQVVEGLGEAILIRPNGTADLRSDPAPEPVRLGWARHLDLLSAEAAELCRTVAVVGANVDVDVLAEVGNQTEGALLGPLQEAVDLGILVDSGGQVRFTHELVREAVHDQLTDTVRRARHRRAAQVFDEHGDEPARVAYHLSFDLRGDDSEALTRIADAARQMAATDPAAALAMIERATAGGGNTAETRLAALRAEPLAWLGRVREAADVARTAVGAAGDPDERHRLSRLLADLMVTLGRPSEVVDVLDQSLAELDDGDPRRPLLAGEVALARFTSGDLNGAGSTAETALAGGDAVAEVLGGLILARLDAHDHNYRSGARRGWEVAQQADAEGTGAAHRYLPWFFCALTGFDLDSPDGPAALMHGRDRCDQHATYWATPLYDGLAAAMAYREGRYDDCLAEAEASYESALETGSVQGIVWCLAHRALVELDRGDEHATETLAEAESWWSTGRALLGIDHYFLATARHRQRAGDLAGAFEHLDGGWQLFHEMGLANCQPLLAPDLTRIATALGHRDRADAVGADMSSLAERGEALSHTALAAWCGGLASGDAGPIGEAHRIFTEMGRGTDALWSGMDLAVLQGQAGRRVEARNTRDQVVALLERQQLAALEREFLRATEPFELGKAQRHVRPRFGWGSLTKTERAIVEAVAAGRTNAEIADNRSVSIRTVESHLYRVYPKLGIDTRTQLAVAAAEHFRKE